MRRSSLIERLARCGPCPVVSVVAPGSLPAGGAPLASAAVSFGGDDRLVSDYMGSEFLSRISRREALRAQLSRDRGASVPGVSALTAAELRLLPLLSTRLPFPQIAGEMVLSRYTIKSQAMSIYRKLGASSRSQAATRSRELGLLEG